MEDVEDDFGKWMMRGGMVAFVAGIIILVSAAAGCVALTVRVVTE